MITYIFDLDVAFSGFAQGFLLMQQPCSMVDAYKDTFKLLTLKSWMNFYEG